MPSKQSQTASCVACRFFYITYDTAFPYGCRTMGFKSRSLPMHAVAASSGMPCLAFVQKKKRKPPGT
jgi:hypothetical protein